jgi:hypothetical protein
MPWPIKAQAGPAGKLRYGRNVIEQDKLARIVRPANAQAYFLQFLRRSSDSILSKQDEARDHLDRSIVDDDVKLQVFGLLAGCFAYFVTPPPTPRSRPPGVVSRTRPPKPRRPRSEFGVGLYRPHFQPPIPQIAFPSRRSPIWKPARMGLHE